MRQQLVSISHHSRMSNFRDTVIHTCLRVKDTHVVTCLLCRILKCRPRMGTNTKVGGILRILTNMILIILLHLMLVIFTVTKTILRVITLCTVIVCEGLECARGSLECFKQLLENLENTSVKLSSILIYLVKSAMRNLSNSINRSLNHVVE